MKRSPIRRVSKKRALELEKYAKLREKFLTDQPWCEIGAVGCTRKAREIHHIKSRYGKWLNDKKWFLAVCRSCHRFAHDNPKIAREKGWIQT